MFKKNPLLLSVFVSIVIALIVGSLSGYFVAKRSITEKGLPSISKSGITTKETLKEESAVIAVAEKVAPAVVSIIVTKDLPKIEQFFFNPFEGDPFFEQFELRIPGQRQNGTEKKEIGGGSGFIISPDGLILTNKHVIVDPRAEYTVLTNDEKRYPAKVLAQDPFKDIAVLKIEAKNLPAVELGDSDALKIGQTVIAVGNALGEFKNTVSTGVVSGLRRSIVAGGGGVTEQLENVIQTDAAINPGNSGGPLLNIAGQVIGINTALAYGAENIGFAIPINEAKKDIEEVQKTGRISRPFLGIRYVMINKEVKEKNNLPYDFGALVIRGEKPEEIAVVPGSPADQAGIQENDIILEINREKITEENPLWKIIQKYNAYDTIEIKFFHKGQELTKKITLQEAK